MREMAYEARARLWFWLSEAGGPDERQRAWKRRRLEGMLLACERTGILSAAELAEWRAAVAGGVRTVERAGDAAAAERHLDELLREVRPLSRDPDATALSAGRRFRGALEALRAAGVLDDEACAGWHARELRASAPWLEADAVAEITARSDVVWAIGVPAETPEEEAEDARSRDQAELGGRRGELRHVLVCPAPVRHDGTAVIAFVARSEATDVLFHHVGPPKGQATTGHAAVQAFGEIVEALTPPELADDVGTTYRAVSDRPVGSHGAGGMPDPERPHAVTGVWRYVPGPPPAARELVATLGSASWRSDR